MADRQERDELFGALATRAEQLETLSLATVDELARIHSRVEQLRSQSLPTSVGEVRKSVSPSDSLTIDFGELRRLTPISPDWGLERGRPVDRYYIERFLAPRATAIRGHVLEMEEPTYTTAFGGDRVTRSDVLDVGGSAIATYTCRLEAGDEIASDSFDCIVCTQVLQYIYDLPPAVRTLHRILKPGGILLLTAPAITPFHGGEEYGDAWHWGFTAASLARLCTDAFGGAAIDMEVFGNVLAASAFLYGLTDADLTQEELDYFDPAYPVTVCVQAMK